jgi:hypothetical protein
MICARMLAHFCLTHARGTANALPGVGGRHRVPSQSEGQSLTERSTDARISEYLATAGRNGAYRRRPHGGPSPGLIPPKGLIGAFTVRTAPDAVTVVVVDGGAADDALDGLAEKLAGRAEPVAEQVGPAQDLIALADDGRIALS